MCLDLIENYADEKDWLSIEILCRMVCGAKIPPFERSDIDSSVVASTSEKNVTTCTKV